MNSNCLAIIFMYKIFISNWISIFYPFFRYCPIFNYLDISSIFILTFGCLAVIAIKIALIARNITKTYSKRPSMTYPQIVNHGVWKIYISMLNLISESPSSFIFYAMNNIQRRGTTLIIEGETLKTAVKCTKRRMNQMLNFSGEL